MSILGRLCPASRRPYLSYFLFCLSLLPCVLLGSSCGSKDSPGRPDPEPGLIDHLSYGCQGNPGKAAEDTTSLIWAEFQADSLVLWIHFTANCCPEFVDSVFVESRLDGSDGRVTLVVSDVGDGCHCMCLFEDRFTIHTSLEPPVSLHFEIRRGTDTSATMDAVVTGTEVCPDSLGFSNRSPYVGREKETG